MKHYFSRAVLVTVVVLLSATPVLAHVPYIEGADFTANRPFVIQDSVEHSKAVYAWFDTGTDADYYTFAVSRPTRLFAQALVPVCPGYEQLLPWLAVVGPGLPAPTVNLPAALPSGYGAVVVQNYAPGESRPTFYEPIGGKWYYDAPAFDQVVTTPGKWYLYYWDPYQVGGDYVASIGMEEFFSPRDLRRSAIITPMIRNDEELHVACPQNK